MTHYPLQTFVNIIPLVRRFQGIGFLLISQKKEVLHSNCDFDPHLQHDVLDAPTIVPL